MRSRRRPTTSSRIRASGAADATEKSRGGGMCPARVPPALSKDPTPTGVPLCRPGRRCRWSSIGSRRPGNGAHRWRSTRWPLDDGVPVFFAVAPHRPRNAQPGGNRRPRSAGVPCPAGSDRWPSWRSEPMTRQGLRQATGRRHDGTAPTLVAADSSDNNNGASIPRHSNNHSDGSGTGRLAPHAAVKRRGRAALAFRRR